MLGEGLKKIGKGPSSTGRGAGPRKMLRVVDQDSAYLRLAPAEAEPEALYSCLKDLLGCS